MRKGNRSGKNFAAIANGFDVDSARGQVVLHIRENLSEYIYVFTVCMYVVGKIYVCMYAHTVCVYVCNAIEQVSSKVFTVCMYVCM